jgi:hypothetical protein
LTPEQALAAMSIFLEKYYARTGAEGDIDAVLGDLQVNLLDGRTNDPAAWADWLTAIDEALQREQLVAADK